MKIGTLAFTLFIVISCNSRDAKSMQASVVSMESNSVSEHYELIKPPSKIEGLLILFGGFSETAIEIKREFSIHEMAMENGIAVMLMNFNRKLWLKEQEKIDLTKILVEAMASSDISTPNIFMGGSSSGGNVSLLLANYLIESDSPIKPKGVFIVDSPVDLLELYNCSKKNVERKFSEVSVRESERTIATFDAFFGKPENGIEKYELFSPFIYSESRVVNLRFLKDVHVRMYTEPDTVWWKENRMNEYEDMNAFYIQKLAVQLKEEFNPDNVELIETKNRGQRSNGYRHPHSWSIVDKEDLIKWILTLSGSWSGKNDLKINYEK